RNANGHGIRSVAKGNSPFGAIDRFTITRPRNSDVIGGTLANWVAGRMGVAVPYKRLVQLQTDGDDAGIHEVTEAVTGEYEMDRNLTGSSVAVFLSDRSQNTEGKDPWRDRSHWTAVGLEDEEAAERFGELIAILNDSLITMAERRAQLEALIDAEAFNLYHAAIRVLGVPAEEWIGTAL